MTKFAFFGCWNKVHYPSDDCDTACLKIQENEPKTKCDEFSSVINEIKRQDVDFLVVAGDNYYPQKKTDDNGNKTKIFSQPDFDKGFNALKSVDKPTYLLIGNHDVDNIAPKEKTKKDKSKKDKSKKGGNLEGKDCRVIDAEIEFVKDSKIKMFDYKTELIVEEMQETNTLCIMVDTNFDEPLDCYSSLLKEEDKHLKREQINAEQKTMIKKIIDDYRNQNQNPIQNVCFFGHHPLLCLKEKKGKVILEDDNMEWNHFLFHVILENGLQDIPNKYYFCADLHHYQTGVVTITNGNKTILINQYIAGTGGAHMDPKILPKNIIEEEHLRKIEKHDITSSYVMNESIEKNGFLIIDDNLKVVFHPVYFSKKAKSLSHLPSLRSKSRSKSRSRSRSRGRSHYLSRRGKLGIIRSNSLGGKTRRIKRKSKKNKH